MKILHFADAHIDHVQSGRLNKERGLHERVIDFENSLITIVDTAIAENVDLVIFAGDAYKGRSPHPTYQRLFEGQIYKLSAAKIQTILLTGNHDMPKAARQAHAMQEFETLKLPYIHVISSPAELTEEQLGLPVRVIGIPWIYRERLADLSKKDLDPSINVDDEIVNKINAYISGALDSADPNVLQILVAHATVGDVKVGDEKTLLMGNDIRLPAGLLKDDRLDYVALGHIHRAQNMNGPDPSADREYKHPPVIYPGSIERLDFGEMDDKKYFIVADVQKGKTEVEWRELTEVRPFITVDVNITDQENMTQQVLEKFPKIARIEEAFVRMNITFPAEWRGSLDEAEIRALGDKAFSFKLNFYPEIKPRTRLGSSDEIAQMSEMDLLEKYLETSSDLNTPNKEELIELAKEILSSDEDLL